MGWGKVFFHPLRTSRELERMEGELTDLSRQLEEARGESEGVCRQLSAAKEEILRLEKSNSLLEAELKSANGNLREQTELEQELASVMEKLEQTADMKSRYEKRIAVLRRQLSEERAKKDGADALPEDIDMTAEAELSDDKTEESPAPDSPPAKSSQLPRQLNLFNDTEKRENGSKEDPIDLLSPLPEDFLEA